jgi:hypothetical protein
MALGPILGAGTSYEAVAMATSSHDLSSVNLRGSRICRERQPLPACCGGAVTR